MCIMAYGSVSHIGVLLMEGANGTIEVVHLSSFMTALTSSTSMQMLHDPSTSCLRQGATHNL